MVQHLEGCFDLPHMLVEYLEELAELGNVGFVLLAYACEYDADLKVDMFLFVIFVIDVLEWFIFLVLGLSDDGLLIFLKAVDCDVLEEIDEADGGKKILLLFSEIVFNLL